MGWGVDRIGDNWSTQTWKKNNNVNSCSYRGWNIFLPLQIMVLRYVKYLGPNVSENEGHQIVHMLWFWLFNSSLQTLFNAYLLGGFHTLDSESKNISQICVSSGDCSVSNGSFCSGLDYFLTHVLISTHLKTRRGPLGTGMALCTVLWYPVFWFLGPWPLKLLNLFPRCCDSFGLCFGSLPV